MLRKAFYPVKPTIPLLHVDTTWKFQEMIRFRDAETKRLGFKLLVHINEEGVRDGIGPFTHGSKVHTDVMKTQALRQAPAARRYHAAIRRARRDEEGSRAEELALSVRA